MTPFAIAPTLAAVLNLFLVYWVYSSPRENAVRWPFLFWNLWMGFWNVSIGIGYLIPDPNQAFRWFQWTIPVSIAFIAPFFLHFIVALCRDQRRPTRWIVRLAYGTGFLFTIIGTRTTLLIRPCSECFWGNYPVAGPYAWAYGVAYVSLVAYAFQRLGSALRNSDATHRNQLRCVFYGALVCFGSGLTNFLPLFDVRIYPIGNLMNSVYSLIVAYAIIEHEFLNVRFVLRQGTVYGILSGGLTAVYLSLVAILQKLFGHYGVEEHVVFYMAAFPVTVLLAPSMKTRLEPFVDEALFGEAPRDQKQAHSAQDMAVMGVLATEISHELSKPLTHIMNAGTRLEKGLKGHSLENLRTIEKEVQRAVEILDGFALLSPNRQLHRIPYSLPELMEEALEAAGLKTQERILIVRRYEPLPLIPVNPGQIVQVLTNIIQNAWQAMGDRGTLTLMIRKQHAGSSREVVILSVNDTGPGIPPEIHAKIFEPFFTTKKNRGGRGVGLTISRAMVERHGGQIQFESPIYGHSGTSVTIALPIIIREGSAYGE